MEIAGRNQGLLDDAYRKAQKLLASLNKRDIETAYRFRDQILFNSAFDLTVWIRRDRVKTSLILYALAQILSRYCLFQASSKKQDCQFERIDNLLGISYDAAESSCPNLLNCSLDTAARITFYYAASALHRRRYELAHRYYGDVLRDGQRLRDNDLQANAHFYLSTCDRKRPNRQEAAVEHLVASKRCLQAIDAQKRIAVVEIHRVWEEFSLGRFDDAVRVARLTERNSGTDFSTKAHAQSLLARIERRRMNYEGAKKLTKIAIKNYEKRDPHHRALARAYANLAHTNVLLAKATSSMRGRQRLLASASQELDHADQIYGHRHYDTGTRPEVENLRAMIMLLRDDFFSAFDKARGVFEEATLRDDYVEMSTARIIQCMCLLYRPAEVGNLDEKTNPKVQDYIAAYDCAAAALASAQKLGQGKHSRRRARAHVWLGSVLLRPPFLDIGRAEEQRKLAEKALPPPQGQAGYIGEELRLLTEQINEMDNAERTGVVASSSDIIYQITACGLLAGDTWKQTKHHFEESLISFLVNGGMRHSDICDRFHIKTEALTAIFHRCVEKRMVSQTRLDARKGPHQNSKVKSEMTASAHA